MLKSELVREIQKEEYQKICKKLCYNYWQDLYQELNIIILEYDAEKILRIESKDSKYFIVGILCRMAHSVTSPFYKKIRKPLLAYKEDSVYNDNPKLDEALDEFEKVGKLHKSVTDLYYKHGSFRKVEEKEGINYQLARTIHKETIDKIKYKVMPINILLVTNGDNGLKYHRQGIPHARLQQMNESVIITELRARSEGGKFYEASIEGIKDEELSKFNIIYFLRQLSYKSGSVDRIISKCHSLGIKVILDIDDIWELPKSHPMYEKYKAHGVAEETKQAVAKVDYVVTTTPYFANIISEYNTNVSVFPNCIHPEEKQFIPRDIPNDRVRIGWIGGVYHYSDIKMIENNFCRLYKDKDIRDRFQICLGGYNYPNPEYQAIEKIMTCNYEFRYSDATYMNYLESQTPVMEHITYDKPYRRLYGRAVNTYGELYNEIDIALIPLEQNKFSACKSELKIVEAGWMSKCVVVSDVTPYAEYIEHGVNGIKISPKRNSIDWYIEIKRLIQDPKKVKEMGDNLNKTIKKHFNLDKHNERRLALYKDIIG